MANNKKRQETMKIRFTREELKWIERTADEESARAMKMFYDIVKTNLERLDEKEKTMLKKTSGEIIDLYLFLNELRNKLEMWDRRFDIGEELRWKK